MRKAGSTATVRNHRRIGRATPTRSAAGAKRVRPLRVDLYTTQQRPFGSSYENKHFSVALTREYGTCEESDD